MKSFNMEWCSLTLFNRFKICLQFEFDPNQWDVIALMFSLKQGIACTILGLTIGIAWKSSNV